MSRRLSRSLPISALASVWLCAAVQAAIQPGRVLLVINRSSDASVEAAAEYVGRRGIPPGHQCLVEAPESAAVDRTTYEQTIERPVADCLRRHQLHDQILVLVTTPGLPWLIEGDGGPFGDLASVDSELSLLYRRLAGEDVSPYGKVLNPYFRPELTRRGFPIFRRDDMDIYLVGRLSLAGTADILPNEPPPPPDGVFALDLASPRRTLLRTWLDSTRELLAQAGRTVDYQDTGSWISPTGTVLGVAAEVPPADAGPPPPWRWFRGGTAVLMGDTWSEGGCGKGAPGAQGGGSCPPELAGRWLQEGALAVLFQVADPGQDGYPRPQILFPSLLEGLSVVEAAYLSSRYLSWRLVVLGDPLAVPFPAREPAAEPWNGRLDPATGLPEHFSRRRTQLLMRKYRTSLEAVATLLKAESHADRGQTDEALRLLDQALALDPALGEAVLYKARILEEAGALEEAFAAYRRCLELRAGGEEAIQRILAGLALDRLNDPERASPHVGWLFQQKGLRDPEVIRMWLEVKLGTGDLDEAEALSLRLVRDSEQPPAFALETLGRVAESRGDYRTAAQFYRRALGAGADGSRLQHKLEESERQASSPGREGPVSGTASPSAVVETEAEDSARGAAVTMEEVIRARVVQRTALEYPKSAALAGESGRVVLRLLIDERGQLLKVTPLAGPKSLVKAAEAAVRQWTFAPKTVGGRPEVDSINIAINFEIPKPEPPK